MMMKIPSGFPSSFATGSICLTLYVVMCLLGERPAAMQSNDGVSTVLLNSPLILSTLLLGSVWLDGRLTTWVT